MTLGQLKNIFRSFGCNNLFVKRLSPNDNSKNQVYLGGNFEVLNILPISEIVSEPAGDWKKERFKAKLDFSWLTSDIEIANAPNTQLILYPKYPEVRLSGFLNGCKQPPSDLMASRLEGRLLFLSSTHQGKVLAFVSGPDTSISKEFDDLGLKESLGVFCSISLNESDNLQLLLNTLKVIGQKDWIKSKRLNSEGTELPCKAPNCGGYTLEAELGISPNGYSEPDFLGWEIKQYAVPNFNRLKSSVITLMTPEPNGGLYKSEGIENFIRTFGYKDTRGRPDRMNFGGIHKAGNRHNKTLLELRIDGYDSEANRIRNSDGKIALYSPNGTEAASWSLASLLLHWNRKHNLACYIPSISSISPLDSARMYKYGMEVLLGEGTDFMMFLKQLSLGRIYYDPGIKLENISTKPSTKRRSQFRIKSCFLPELYKASRVVNLSSDGY